MDVRTLKLEGLKLIVPKVHRDSRGFFLESYHEARYQTSGVECKFVQDNHSCSGRDTLRGMHYQTDPGQAKLLRVVRGRIFDVAVDIRRSSPTFGQWEGIYLDSEEHVQLFVPHGFAHGFCVVSDAAEVLYKVSSVYDPQTEMGFAYNDPQVGIAWPSAAQPILSARDLAARGFAAMRDTFPA